MTIAPHPSNTKNIINVGVMYFTNLKKTSLFIIATYLVCLLDAHYKRK